MKTLCYVRFTHANYESVAPECQVHLNSHTFDTSAGLSRPLVLNLFGTRVGFTENNIFHRKELRVVLGYSNALYLIHSFSINNKL